MSDEECSAGQSLAFQTGGDLIAHLSEKSDLVGVVAAGRGETEKKGKEEEEEEKEEEEEERVEVTAAGLNGGSENQKQPSSSIGERVLEVKERDTSAAAASTSTAYTSPEQEEEEEKKKNKEEEEEKGTMGGKQSVTEKGGESTTDEDAATGGYRREGGRTVGVSNGSTQAAIPLDIAAVHTTNTTVERDEKRRDCVAPSLLEKGGGGELEESLQSTSELGSGVRSLEHSTEVYSTVVSPHLSRSTQSPFNTLSLQEEMLKVDKEGDEAGEGGGEGDRQGKEEELQGSDRKAGEGLTAMKRQKTVGKSQLLQSAGIHLQGVHPSLGTHGPPYLGSCVMGEGVEGEDVRGEGGEGVGKTFPKVADRHLEQFSEILLDSDVSPTNSEVSLSPTLPLPQGTAVVEGSVEVGGSEEAGKREAHPKAERRVRFADELVDTPQASSASLRPAALPETKSGEISAGAFPRQPVTPTSPSVTSPHSSVMRSPSAPHTPYEIIAGVEYSAEYLGSTPILLTGAASAKSARMQQAQQVVKLFKDPDNDTQPRFPVKVKISSQCIKIADSGTNIDLMDHPLYTISYVADIENVLVIMITRIPVPPTQPIALAVRQEEGAGEGRGGEGGERENGREVRGGGGRVEVVEGGSEGGGEEDGMEQRVGKHKLDNEGKEEKKEKSDKERGREEEGNKEEVTDMGGESGKEGVSAVEGQAEREGKLQFGDQKMKEEGKREEEQERKDEGQRDTSTVEGAEHSDTGPIPRMTCHVLETNDARHVAMVIGQAFSVAYKEFLRANGISEDALEEAEYAHILNAQSAPQAEVDVLRDQRKIKKLAIPKHKGDILGVMLMDSGYGSALPTPVIAHMSKNGCAARSGLLNIGDHIISINGVNMVGMSVKVCIEQVKKCRPQNLVKISVVSCSTVVDVTIVRPDLKFQLGFTIQDGVVCSLMRGSIAERSGVRVGHYIIEVNGTSTVGITHKDLVHLLTTTVGDLHLKTMPHLMYKLITGQMQPLHH